MKQMFNAQFLKRPIKDPTSGSIPKKAFHSVLAADIHLRLRRQWEKPRPRFFL
jgi:hypothetical protein